MADPLKGRVFTQEEVNTILSRAVERQNPSAGGLSYAELVDSAREAGIDPDAIRSAVEDLGTEREASTEDAEVEAELARRKWRGWRSFSIHFTVFVMFSILIAVLNIHELNKDPNAELFFPIPILTWGIGIAAHFMAVFFPTVFPSPDRADAIRRQLRRRDEKLRKRERKERFSAEAGELKESAKELGVAVQRGMATILSDVAKTIHEEVDRASRTPGQRPGQTGNQTGHQTGKGPGRPPVRVETRARVGQDDPLRDDGGDDEDDGAAGKRASRRR